MEEEEKILGRKPNDYEIWEYAINILPNTPTFKDFAIAMMDFLGGVETKIVVGLYEKLLHTDLPFDVTPEKNYDVDEQTLDGWYSEFLEEQEKKRRDERKKIMEDIDELVHRTVTYRNSQKFHDMISYVGMMPYLAPYNAMLVDLQKPGTKIAFSISRWRDKYGRRPTINATPFIILVPFGPVQAIYDYESTEMIEGMEWKNKAKMELIEEWCNTLNKTNGHLDKQKWDMLLNNLPVYGIDIDNSFRAATTYGGYLRKFRQRDEYRANLKIPFAYDKKEGETYYMTARARFIISINGTQSLEAKFHTLCHELGHLFCRHRFYDDTKCGLTHKEKEFEAETVAWIVCKRHGVMNPSEEYLATYSRNGEIPECSLDMIMKAVTEIEKMIRDDMKVKDALWYKHDNDFKKEVDAKIEEYNIMKKLREG